MIVDVSDTGPGLDPNHVGRLFDAFFTTIPTGIGLGLAIVRSIVEDHRGAIRAGANEGGGAGLTVSPPA